MSNHSSVSPRPSTARRLCWCVVLSLLVALAGAANVYVWQERRPLPEGADLEAPEELSFDGATEKLKHTVVAPTLERPIPKGKSVIWCATAAMAWQVLEKTIVKRPLRVKGAEEICRELSDMPDPKLEGKNYYAAAGFGRDGFTERVRRELALKFPNVQFGDIPSVDADSILAVACLEVALSFDVFFKHSAEPLFFQDPQGASTPVHAFGIRKEDKDAPNHEFRGQVLVLFRDKGEFAIDLSRSTTPYQIILARMARKANLNDTLADLEKRNSAGAPNHLDHSAIMLVPSMNWRIVHRYRDLENECVDFPAPVGYASQMIQFKMDRKGAYVASMMAITLPDGDPVADPNPNHYLFDRPFLIVMRRRGHAQPFFVMWVDNAELLQKH